MKSSHKLKFERSQYIHSTEQPLIKTWFEEFDLKDLKFYKNESRLKSILQSRSSLLPSYCIRLSRSAASNWAMNHSEILSPFTPCTKILNFAILVITFEQKNEFVKFFWFIGQRPQMRRWPMLSHMRNFLLLLLPC